jgi:hypothetical protein
MGFIMKKLQKHDPSAFLYYFVKFDTPDRKNCEVAVKICLSRFLEGADSYMLEFVPLWESHSMQCNLSGQSCVSVIRAFITQEYKPTASIGIKPISCNAYLGYVGDGVGTP